MTSTAALSYQCSLVIPTKDGGELFQQVMASLAQQSIWGNVELIVVDSGSSDQTVQIAKKGGAIVVEIAPETFNHGATRDFGIAMASCEVVILMVQDAVLENQDALLTMMRNFSDPEVAGVYARQKPRNDADLLTKRNLNNWLTGREVREVRTMQSLAWYEALPPIEKYFFCNFDNVLSAIRKSVWQEQKFGFISFGEDIDWAERVLKMSFRIVYEPGAIAVHSHDRPMSHEYKRTYVCHRKLYQQFQLQLVPRIRDIFGPWVASTWRDLQYVNNQNVPFTSKYRYWLKIPLLNLFSAIAQYRAARDEKSGTLRTMQGV